MVVDSSPSLKAAHVGDISYSLIRPGSSPSFSQSARHQTESAAPWAWFHQTQWSRHRGQEEWDTLAISELISLHTNTLSMQSGKIYWRAKHNTSYKSSANKNTSQNSQSYQNCGQHCGCLSDLIKWIFLPEIYWFSHPLQIKSFLEADHKKRLIRIKS